jgi:hypothetical protein
MTPTPPLHSRPTRATLVRLVVLALLSAAAPSARAQTSAADSATIVGVVERYIEALSARDTAYLRAASLPRMTFVSVRAEPGPDDRAAERALDEYLASLAREPRRSVGRIWSPVVTVQGPLASLVAPYDAYYDGQFSHCGLDHYVLARSGGQWLVSQLIFTRQREGCRSHPLGPPR